MWKRSSTIRGGFLAAAVLVALGFGTTEAFAGPECSPGVPPDTCSPDCNVICEDAGYPPFGQCLWTLHNCCQCVEK